MKEKLKLTFVQIEGLKNNNLHFYDYAVSGYIGAVSFLDKLADVLKELKDKNPDLVKNSFNTEILLFSKKENFVKLK